MTNLDVSGITTENLYRGDKEFAILVDTDIEIIIKDKINGEILKFRRTTPFDGITRATHPKLPILIKGNVVFALFFHIRRNELCLCAEKQEGSPGNIECKIQHNYLTENVSEYVLENTTIEKAMEKLRAERDELPELILANQFKIKIDYKKKNTGRTKMTKKWAA